MNVTIDDIKHILAANILLEDENIFLVPRTDLIELFISFRSLYVKHANTVRKAGNMKIERLVTDNSWAWYFIFFGGHLKSVAVIAQDLPQEMAFIAEDQAAAGDPEAPETWST